jgi:hypothetical protein
VICGQSSSFATQRQRQGACGREGVGAGEGAVAEVQGAIGTQCETFAQRLARLRRTHRDGNDLAAVRRFELHGLDQRPDVKSADLAR